MINRILAKIYENNLAEHAISGISSLISKYKVRLQALRSKKLQSQAIAKSDLNGDKDIDSLKKLPWDESDVFIILYGDSFLPTGVDIDAKPSSAELGVGGGIDEEGTIFPISPKPTLKALKDFASKFLDGVASGIHILPFFPYSSDDGFSIVDYYRVNPTLGDWEDIRDIAGQFRLMADSVLNHCSAKSAWFKSFLAGDSQFASYFIDLDPRTDLSQIVRPRTHPLLSEFEGRESNSGRKLHVWTTFSKDQVDLNFANPDVLIQLLDALLFLVEQGVEVIRLDAIAYLWKEVGTPSIHHEKTHLIVQLYRRVLEEIAPWVILITETNVPHKENMSYFGTGNNESHMIYQFSLPPLVIDAFLRGRVEHLRNWARTIPNGVQGEIGYDCSYFNFCASHDGIGITPAYGILSKEEIDSLCSAMKERGGYINYKSSPAGDIPYEMNITYFNAIAETSLSQEQRVKKFLASQSILLAFVGIPGIYIHSLIASENWQAGVELSGANRSINRQKLFLSEVESELQNPESLRSMVYRGYTRMIKVRRSRSAFHPAGAQSILQTGCDAVLAILREAPASSALGKEGILCLVNASEQKQLVSIAEIITSNTREESQDRVKNIAYMNGFIDLLSDRMISLVDSQGSLIDMSGMRTKESNSSHTQTYIPLEQWEVLWLMID